MTEVANNSLQQVDLTAFPDAEQSVAALAKLLGDFKLELDLYKADLLTCWVGEGRNEFEKSYNIMTRKIQDQIDYTWVIYEELIAAHERFLQADVDAAKAMYSSETGGN